MDAQQALDRSDSHVPRFLATPGLTMEVVERISSEKNEPGWMLDRRKAAFLAFSQTKIPSWGPDLSKLSLEDIRYFAQPNAKEEVTWDRVPSEIRETFEYLGIPEAERQGLGGVGAQYDSLVVYHRLREDLIAQGVLFENMDTALQKYPDYVKKYFMTRCVPVRDHAFAMLHAAVWSGGTFIYVPPGVRVQVPLSAYFRMNAARGGQFEHTLIIADEGSEIEYIEGCSAPKYDDAALHAGCVEIFVGKGAKVRYASVENWSKNTYNLNTKRAIVEEDGEMIWINGNMGSAVTMLYPMTVLLGDRAKNRYEGFSYAGSHQVQDTGHKVAHVGRDTTSFIHAKSITTGDGVSRYRGLVKINAGADRAKVHVACDSLLFGEMGTSHAVPCIEQSSPSAEVLHEARIGSVDEGLLAYLSARGFSRRDALHAVISGFADPIVAEFPLEYAVEFRKLLMYSLDQTQDVV